MLFILGNCKQGRCVDHYKWEEYREYAVPQACFDCFTQKPHRGGGGSTELKLSPEEIQELSDLALILGSNRFLQGDKLN